MGKLQPLKMKVVGSHDTYKSWDDHPKYMGSFLHPGQVLVDFFRTVREGLKEAGYAGSLDSRAPRMFIGFEGYYNNTCARKQLQGSLNGTHFSVGIKLDASVWYI